jgi:hypothetical protein
VAIFPCLPALPQIPEGATCDHVADPNTRFKFLPNLPQPASITSMVNNVGIPIGGGAEFLLRFDRPFCKQCAIWKAEAWLSEPFDQEHFNLVAATYDFEMTYADASKVFQCRGDCLLMDVHLYKASNDHRLIFRLLCCQCGLVDGAPPCNCETQSDSNEAEFSRRLAFVTTALEVII